MEDVFRVWHIAKLMRYSARCPSCRFFKDSRMIETLTLITLSVLLLIYFRPGKTPPLDNPLLIERPGQYCITLAPRLNLAQPFIEAIAKELATAVDSALYSKTQCFAVYDKQVAAHGYKHYLLAITQRNGKLFFQGISPDPLLDQAGLYDMLMEFCNATMAKVLATGLHSIELDERIVSAVKMVAQQRQVEISECRGG